MAFSSVKNNVIELPGGLVLIEGTFNGASVTTGNITFTDTTPEISKLLAWGASSDSDNAALVCATDTVGTLKITFNTSDTGGFFVIGKAV